MLVMALVKLKIKFLSFKTKIIPFKSQNIQGKDVKWTSRIKYFNFFLTRFIIFL